MAWPQGISGFNGWPLELNHYGDRGPRGEQAAGPLGLQLNHIHSSPGTTGSGPRVEKHYTQLQALITY